MRGEFWRTPALYDLRQLFLEERQSTKPQPSQPALLHKTEKELSSYLLTIQELENELNDPSLPYDMAETIGQRLLHFKRMAAISQANIRNFRTHREQVIKQMAEQAGGHFHAIPKTFIEFLSDEDTTLLHHFCEKFAILVKERPSVDPHTSTRVFVMFLKEKILPDFNSKISEENLRPLRLYPKGILTRLPREYAQIAEKEGYVMILKISS